MIESIRASIGSPIPLALPIDGSEIVGDGLANRQAPLRLDGVADIAGVDVQRQRADVIGNFFRLDEQEPIGLFQQRPKFAQRLEADLNFTRDRRVGASWSRTDGGRVERVRDRCVWRSLRSSIHFALR